MEKNFNQTLIKIPRKDKQVNVIGLEDKEEELSTETHEEVPTLPTKTVITVMGDHLDRTSIHDVIDITTFHYHGVSTVGPEFDEYTLMTIGKNWDREDNDKSHNNFQNKEGTLKSWVTE